MQTGTEKQRDARVRGRAKRLGYLVLRSRSRSPMNPCYGMYLIVDADTNCCVLGSRPFDYSLTLEEVEAYFDEPTEGEHHE